MQPFGLDLSDAMIRLVVVERRGRSLRMPVRAEIPVQEGWILDGEIRNPAGVAGLLKELIKAAGVKTREAVAALPERHTFIKQIALSADTSLAVNEQIVQEAGQHLPYAIDEVYVDWYTLSAKNSLGQTQVVLGAAPKNFVDAYVATLHQADIQPIRLEIESLAIARAVIPESTSAGARLVLDLGRTKSTVILVQDGAVLFSGTIRYGGKELNRYIADTLHISLIQAERAKTIFGLDPARGKGLLRRVLLPQLDVIVQKVNEVTAFYEEHFPDHRDIQEVLVTGSGALLRGIDHELADRLGRPVRRQPSWVYDSLHIDDQARSPDVPFTYATAFGLALEQFESHV